MTFGLFAAIHGRLADRLGTRRLYLFGLTSYAVLGLVIGFSSTIESMIGLRVIQGAGAAAMPALGSLIVSRTFSPDRRGWAMGVILGAVGFAASIGPFIGGLIADYLSWRAVFCFPALSLLVTPFAWISLPRSLDKTTRTTIDWLSPIFMGGFIFGILWLPKSMEYTAFMTGVQGTTILVLVSSVLFIWRTTTARNPFIPRAFYRNPVYSISVGTAFLAQATRFGTLVLIPILLIDVHNLSATMVGLALCPSAIAVALLSPKMGAISDQRGPRWPVTFGLIAMLIGNIVTIIAASGSVPFIIVGTTLYGVGFAGIQSPLMNAVSEAVENQDLGIGMGLFMTIFFIGGATGVAISATLVEWQSAAPTHLLPFAHDAGEAFANALLFLTVLGGLALGLSRFLPYKNRDI